MKSHWLNQIKQLKELGEKVFIVTDRVMLNIGNVFKLTELLEEVKLEYEIFDEVNCEPEDTIVEIGVERCKSSNCDFLIALG